MAVDGGCFRDMVHRLNREYNEWGALKCVMSNRGFFTNAEKCPYEGVIASTAFYGAEAWGMISAKSRKVNVLEEAFVGVSEEGVTRMDRVGNEEVHRYA